MIAPRQINPFGFLNDRIGFAQRVTQNEVGPIGIAQARRAQQAGSSRPKRIAARTSSGTAARLVSSTSRVGMNQP